MRGLRALSQKLFLMMMTVLWLVASSAVRVWSAEEELKLYAKAAVLMDAESGRILYEKNGEQILPMASTTKILTCILALEYGNPEDEVVFSAYAASMPKVHLGAEKGASYRMQDLLYSLMLESHNDTAVAIAEHIAVNMLCVSDSEETTDVNPEAEKKEIADIQSVRRSAAEKETSAREKEESRELVLFFAELMNEKAEKIGCEHSFFLTPNGLDAVLNKGTGQERIHSTTAVDLARILSYCITESPMAEEFLNITRTQAYTITSMNGKQAKALQNHNAFLKMMDGALTGKTGYTANAGYCYAGALKKEDRVYVIALLACGWPNNRGYKWNDARTLFTYGLSDFERTTYAQASQGLPGSFTKIVENGAGSVLGEPAKLRAVVQKDVKSEESGVLLKRQEKLTVKEEWKEPLQAPVRKGDVIGVRTYALGGQILEQERIVAQNTIEKADFGWCLKQIAGRFVRRGGIPAKF